VSFLHSVLLPTNTAPVKFTSCAFVGNPTGIVYATNSYCCIIIVVLILILVLSLLYVGNLGLPGCDTIIDVQGILSLSLSFSFSLSIFLGKFVEQFDLQIVISLFPGGSLKISQSEMFMWAQQNSSGITLSKCID
jgi:hypothetical protein